MQRDRRRRIARLAAVALALVIIVWAWSRVARRSPSEDALLEGSGSPGAPRRSSAGPRAPSGDRDSGARAPSELSRDEPPERGDPIEGDSREIKERRLARARMTLDRYLASTKYPPGSRPLSEHPDQDAPHQAPIQKLPLARADDKLTDARVILRQDRYFLSDDERVTLTLECETSDGPAPCEVLSSVARSRAYSPRGSSNEATGAPLRSAIVPFSDLGQGGALTAVFAPREQGFEGHHGRIGIEIELRVEGESGRTGFDIEYTPSPPATFTGAVREVIEAGSLSLYVGLDASKAGRYVIQARVDDAEGHGFAYLSFNDELPSGRVEAKLVVFGKLILDEDAKAPFRVRDLEGFLLKEDTHPDRELIPSRDGVVLTTKPYTRRDFSDSEWQSEEKERHLTEFRKDVEEATRALDK